MSLYAPSETTLDTLYLYSPSVLLGPSVINGFWARIAWLGEVSKIEFSIDRSFEMCYQESVMVRKSDILVLDKPLGAVAERRTWLLRAITGVEGLFYCLKEAHRWLRH